MSNFHVMPDTKLPLRDPIHSTLKKQNRLQVIVRPCMEEGHSVWQFQNGNQEGYPKAVRVPTNARKEVSDRAFYSAPMLRHVEVAHGIPRLAWQRGKAVISYRLLSCRPLSSVSKMGSFKDAMCLDKSQPQGVFSLVGGSLQNAARSVAALAPGAQIGPFAFEGCLTLTSVTFAMANNNKSRALPDGSFCGAGIESLRLPPDFHFIGPKACENCKRLIEVDLMCTDITAIWGSTFAYGVALVDIYGSRQRSKESERKPFSVAHHFGKWSSRRCFGTLGFVHSAAVSNSHFSLS